MINEIFLEKARKLITAKLTEATKELGCLPPEIGTIRYSADKFRFKVEIFEGPSAQNDTHGATVTVIDHDQKFRLPKIGICSLIKINRTKAVIQCDATKKRYLLRISAMEKYAIK